MRYTARLLALSFGLSLNVALSEMAAVVNWPDGYVVYANTASPDGRYGVLVPTMEAWEQDESLGEANYLADIKNHRVLGKIDKVDYFEHQNHRGLEVFWAPQSTVCVVENDGRYGADSISVLEITIRALLKQRSAIASKSFWTAQGKTRARSRNGRRCFSVFPIRN